MKALSPMAFFQARQPKRRAAGVNQAMRRAPYWFKLTIHI
jgi:hypothetical protein